MIVENIKAGPVRLLEAASLAGRIKQEVRAEVERMQAQRPCLAAVRVGEDPASAVYVRNKICLLYTSPSPRDRQKSRMPSSA